VDNSATAPLVYALGVTGAVLFYGRFYVQWIASERRRQSIIPIAFWYMSSAGSLMLLVFAVLTQSPVGALGHNLNIVIYSRNLVHIWRERGTLSPRRNVLVHAAVGLIVLVAVGFVARTWLLEYRDTQEMTKEAAQTTWIWLAVGLVGQALFASRFLIQWIATERRRVSFIPTVFWQISIMAAALQAASFLQRSEWIFAIGSLATIVIYARNLWFIRINPARSETVTLNG
jgi:lipid-A-disaccharide synthase-like uncharacterized protein